MKLVFDTNVLIAALISQGVCAELLEHCVLRHTVVSSDFIFAELVKHLSRKFKYTPEEVDAAVSLFKSQMDVVVPDVLDEPVCRDPDDDLILATAVTGAVQCIVTGDKDLLSVKEFQGIRILSPADFSEFEIETTSR